VARSWFVLALSPGTFRCFVLFFPSNSLLGGSLSPKLRRSASFSIAASATSPDTATCTTRTATTLCRSSSLLEATFSRVKVMCPYCSGSERCSCFLFICRLSVLPFVREERAPHPGLRQRRLLRSKRSIVIFTFFAAATLSKGLRSQEGPLLRVENDHPHILLPIQYNGNAPTASHSSKTPCLSYANLQYLAIALSLLHAEIRLV